MSETFVEAQRRLLENLAPATRSRFLGVGGDLVHVLESGTIGDRVLLIHGGGGFAAEYAPVLDALGKRFRVAAPDRPGHGLSAKRDLARVDLRRHATEFVDGVLDALGWESATIVGSSVGGFYALAFAHDRPERVERLALAGAPAGVGGVAPIMLRLMATPGIGRALFALMDRANETSVRRLYKMMLVHDVAKVPQDILLAEAAIRRDRASRRAWRAFLRNFVGLAQGLRYPMDAELPRIRAPTLWLLGDADPMSNWRLFAEAAATMPNAQVEQVVGASHMLWIDRPDALVDGLARFMDEPQRALTDFVRGSVHASGLRQGDTTPHVPLWGGRQE